MAGLFDKNDVCSAAPLRSAAQPQALVLRWFPLVKAETVIGRDRSADIIVPAHYVSRTEAKVVREDGAYYLQSMTSRNATSFKGQVLRRSPRQVLSDGDEIKVGDYLFVFYHRDDDPAGGSSDTGSGAGSGGADGIPSLHAAFSPAWRTDTAVALARHVLFSQDFSALPILADALQDAGCDNAHILEHCRRSGPHAHGCWVLALVLG
jgi:predicted component of type VI protein secretion system